MTGSVALNVVIGLAFIFLLYSLLATTIMELTSTFFAFRARTLRTAITRMLENREDIPDNSNWFMRWVEDWIERFKHLVKSLLDTHEHSLVKNFYKQPSIKYLAPNRFFSKPSYISAENFSKAILDILKSEDKTESTDIEKVQKALEIKNPPDLLNGETRDHIESLLNDSQNDLVKFKLNLEQWFNDTMDRATGWYKRKMQVILLFIGFGIAILFNASTTEITRKLSKDKKTRDQLVQLATDAVKEHQTKRDSVFQLTEEQLKADLNEANTLLGLGWPYSDENFIIRQASVKGKNELAKQSDSLKQEYLIEFPYGFDTVLLKKHLKIRETKVQGQVSIVFDTLGFKLDTMCVKFWGYLLTALAISLGAPFWFDLLNKLVKLRGSVTQSSPNQSSSGQPTSSSQQNTSGETIPARLRKG